LTKFTLNPFIYGKPVPTGRFIGRQSEVRIVFSRLYGGESTAIVGEPHIGKTSLLNYIADESTRHEWIAQVFARTAFVDFDCHLIGADCTPQGFWQQVLQMAAEQIEDETVRQQCQAVTERGCGAFDLESLFQLIGRREYRVALLIDEFDTLLDHSRFGQAEFLAALRSLATRTDGLALITASRLSVAQMNRKSQYGSPSGSPFFNNMIEVRLPHLSRDEAQSLLVDTLKAIKDGVAFEPADLELAYSLAGRHPFLLQIAGASLFDAIADGTAAPRTALRARAEDLFQRRAAAHFDDFWRTLDEPHQRTILVLAMAEQASRLQPTALDWQQMAALPWFENDLRHLAELGAVEWREEGAVLTVGGLRPWLIENVIAGNRYAADFSAWLQAKSNQNLLTAEEMKTLRKLAGELLASGSKEPGWFSQTRNLQDQLVESQRRYSTLTKHIAALDSSIGRELDAERKLTLEERRNELVAERDEILTHLKQLEDHPGV
jgi:hypothetical protein